jgi:tetratricopeptide (TPR) repeat protein
LRFFPDRRRFLLLVLPIVLFIAPSPGFAQDTDPFSRANQLIEAGELDRADSILRSVLREDTGNERALGYLIRVARDRARRERLYDLYRRLADRSPDQFEYYQAFDVFYNAGKLGYQMGDYAYSLTQLNRAQSQLSEDQAGLREQIEGWKLRARSAQQQLEGAERREQLRSLTRRVVARLSGSRFQSARKLLDQQRDVFGGEEAYATLSELVSYYRGLNEWQVAVSDLEDPAKQATLDRLIDTGQRFYRSRYHDSMVGTLPDGSVRNTLRETHDRLRSRTVEPYLARLFRENGRRDFRRGQHEEALNNFLKARSFQSDQLDRSFRASVLVWLARTKYKLGRMVEARSHLEELRRDYPGTSVPASLDWSIWAYNQGPGILYTLVLLVGGTALVLYLIPRFASRGLTYLGQFLGQRAYHQDWISTSFWMYQLFCDPSIMDPDELKRFLSVARRTNHGDRRLELLEMGYESDRLEPADVVEYGRLLRSRSPEKSKEVLESALSDWNELPPGPRAKLARVLSGIYLEEGRREQGYKLLRKLLDQEDGNSKILRKLTRLASSLGRWEEWLSLGQRWHRSVSDTFVQSSQRRVIGETKEETDLADPERIASELLDQYDDQRELDLAEEQTEVIEFLIEMLEEAGKGDTALAGLLEERVDRGMESGEDKQYARELADLYLREDRPEGALELLESLREAHPRDLDVLTQLGSLYVDQDDRERAYDVYVDILGIQNDNVEARSQLQRLGRRFEDENEFEEAEKYYRAILEHSSFQQPEVQLRLGAVLYKQDRTEEALSVFQQINQGEIEFKAKIVGHIGRCLVDLDMHDVAVDRLNEIDLEDGSVPTQTRRTLYYWRGRAREGAGDQQGALEDYRQIMAGDVNFRDVSERVDQLREQVDVD